MDSAVEEKAGRYRTGVFGIALDPSTAQARDEVEGPGESRCGDTPAPVTLAHKATDDSPIRQRDRLPFVDGPVFDPWHFVGSSELAPADAVSSVEHQRRTGGSGAHSVVLALSVDVWCIPGNPFGVKADTPAATEDSVVALDESRECRPRRIESFDPVGGATNRSLP